MAITISFANCEKKNGYRTSYATLLAEQRRRLHTPRTLGPLTAQI
jgi:hypothetical protein